MHRLLENPIVADLVRMIVYGGLILVGILLTVLVMILWLRKYLGYIQNRYGPNRTGPRGYLQTAADALKLLLKEDIIPTLADRKAFILAPSIVFLPAYLVYVVIPFGPRWVAADLNIGILFISAVTSVAVIGFVTAGWASNNKYALLGGLRSAAQIVSYEVPLVLAMLAPVILAGSLRLSDITLHQQNVWYVFITPVLAAAYLTAGLAEVNLTPFDMVEAESELVAGFNTEYSGMKFALFYLAEFANTFTIAAIGVSLYLGGWTVPFAAPANAWILNAGALGSLVAFLIFMTKCWVIVTFTMWIRGTLPRIRVDQLMEFGWKALIPLTLLSLLLNALAVSLPMRPAFQMAGLAAVNWAILIGLYVVGRHKIVPMGSARPKESVSAAIPQRSRI
ncbi:MAG TPA: NADH-quinone oxidoreductase subunit NuoH [Armatimonadota bacterium]|jgi:NADH-quinone oxidoreductase subunit H